MKGVCCPKGDDKTPPFINRLLVLEDHRTQALVGGIYFVSMPRIFCSCTEEAAGRRQ